MTPSTPYSYSSSYSTSSLDLEKLDLYRPQERIEDEHEHEDDQEATR